MKMNKILNITLIILTPILIITTGIRIALSPVFYNLEYRLPNFPPDPFGLTQSERLQWADFSIKFIAGRIEEAAFTAAEFPNGDPLFNEREISHMIDVRDLTVITLWVWRFLVVLFVVIFWSSSLGKLPIHALIGALKSGARLTIGGIVGILLFLVINFDQLFTSFHQIFFEGDSWLFYYSDTLIRLFPLKFWQDLFIFIGALCLLFSLGIITFKGKFFSNREDRKI